MILLWKELSDLSSDLSMRDYEVIVRVVKDVICKVKSGKFGEINLTNEAVRSQSDAVHDLIDEIEEEEDMEPLPESLLNIIYDGEVSNDNTGPSAADNAEAIPHTSNADNCLQFTSSEMIIPTDTAGVIYSEAQSLSQYSHMKTIATPNLEVLKNLC